MERVHFSWQFAVLALAGVLAAGLSGCGRRAHYSDVSAHSVYRAAAPAPRVDEGMRYADYGTNQTTHTADQRSSTFSADVDTASYSLARRYLLAGQLPPRPAVRTEEFLNAMDYDYPSPADGDLAVHVEACPAPFQDRTLLVRVGLQARRVHEADRTPADIVLVLDVSGSMAEGQKWPLMMAACRTLLENLDDRDRVAVVCYNTEARVLAGFTRASERAAVLYEVNRLRPEGATSVQAGMEKAYELAGEAREQNIRNRITRLTHIVLFSDGLANTDATQAQRVLQYARHCREKGVTLTTVGVGFGNYNDAMLQQLADTADGNYHYLDTSEQAAAIFQDNFVGNCQLVAKDVKIRVEFDPSSVSRYRLMGYEKRALTEEQFRDKHTDAGDMGAGKSVTALYAVQLRAGAGGDGRARLAKVEVRYHRPDGQKTRTVESQINVRDIQPTFHYASPDTQRAAVTAYLAEWLRQSYWSQRYRPADLRTLARAIAAPGRFDTRHRELLEMIDRAEGLGEPKSQIQEDDGLWWRKDD